MKVRENSQKDPLKKKKKKKTIYILQKVLYFHQKFYQNSSPNPSHDPVNTQSQSEIIPLAPQHRSKEEYYYTRA